MEKEKRYEEIPAYNQETQYVVEREPVDMGEYIFIGLEVKDMENDLLISVIPELLGGE